MNDQLLKARANWIATTAAVVAEVEAANGPDPHRAGERMIVQAMELWAEHHGMDVLQEAVRQEATFGGELAATAPAANDE